MLAWLAGGSRESEQEERQQGMDTSLFVDQPDTPAHVFVARAFKHSIWGTPHPPKKAEPTKPDLVRDIEEHVTRPRLAVSVSPTKPNGILMTPGTASLRRTKSVTFGCEALNTTKQRSSTAETHDLPSPQIKAAEAENVPTTGSSLRAKLIGARSITAASGEASPGRAHSRDGMGKLTEEPRRDWKGYHEDYAKRTQREMKRLVAKQQAAKQFAWDKDVVACNLADQLKQEQKKVLALEARVADLTARLQKFEIGGSRSPEATAFAKDERPQATVKQDSQDTVVSSSRTRRTSVLAKSRNRAQSITAAKSDATKPSGPGDIWADVLLSSPLKTRRACITPQRTEPAHSRLQENSGPLRERNQNVLERNGDSPSKLRSDRKSHCTNVAASHDLNLYSAPTSSPFNPTPIVRTGTLEVDELAGQTKAMKSPHMAVSTRRDDRPAMSMERAIKARERIAARRRAKKSMLVD